MEVKLADGTKVELPENKVRALLETAKKAAGIKRKGAEEFIIDQPWLAIILDEQGLEEINEHHSVKQGVRNVPCSAGKVIQYTSRYQEIDKTHLDRADVGRRRLLTADFSHLEPCNNVLGKDGVLRTSDFHQTLVCDKCRGLVKRARDRARLELARNEVLRAHGNI